MSPSSVASSPDSTVTSLASGMFNLVYMKITFILVLSADSAFCDDDLVNVPLDTMPAQENKEQPKTLGDDLELNVVQPSEEWPRRQVSFKCV
jgi:hypothetical protein